MTIDCQTCREGEMEPARRWCWGAFQGVLGCLLGIVGFLGTGVGVAVAAETVDLSAPPSIGAAAPLLLGMAIAVPCLVLLGLGALMASERKVLRCSKCGAAVDRA